jgi:hypothetical protein
MHEGTPHAAHRPPQAPKPSARRPAGGLLGDSALDPIEQLTELFLGDLPRAGPADLDVDDLPLPPYKADSPKAAAARRESVVAPPRQAPAAPVRLAPLTLQTEVVVIGHLPVAASAWVHHYANHRQRQLGSPVALLRWRGDTASLDVFGQIPAPTRHPTEPHATIADAVRAAASLADALIVSVEETREIEASQTPGIKRVAVLTGSHDTAVVACYRALKGLVQQESVREGQCEVAVIILGGPDERSRAAAERLERTCASHLSHTIHCEVVNEKISPARSAPLFVGQVTGSPTSFLRGLISPQGSTNSRVASGDTHGSPAAPANTGLVSRFPGLRSVDARCPFAPGVEVAVSPEGEVHVLAAAAQPGDVSKAVADLTACASWVEVNSAVLRSVMPELAKRAGVSQPREHLITTEPKLVRGLLDSRIRLHLDTPGAIVDLN